MVNQENFAGLPDAAKSNPGSAVGVGALLLATALIVNYVAERRTLLESWKDLFFPSACFFLFVIGLVVLIGGLIRSRITEPFFYAFSIALPSRILYAMLYMGVQFLQTGADRLGECTGLDNAAARTNVIPESEWRPGRAAVGCGVERRGMLLTYYNSIGIYGVTEAAAQQRIVDSLTEHYRRLHTHPVRVMFYEKENWNVRQGKNGATFGSRGPEKLIRVVNIG